MLPFNKLSSRRLQLHTVVSIYTLAYPLGDTVFDMLCFADCLILLDETTVSGAAVASDVLCNRALVLVQETPPDHESALQDATSAIACNKSNCKVSKWPDKPEQEDLVFCLAVKQTLHYWPLIAHGQATHIGCCYLGMVS